MKEKKRIPTDGKPSAWSSPFEVLKDLKIPTTASAPSASKPADVPAPPPAKKRGRVDILRQTAHRGGKTVTVVTNFTGVGPAEKEQLAKTMQKACGAGGTVKEGRIEIQGDHRDTVAEIQAAAGFRPVFAGG